jgi:ABC-type Fe3+-hydroxamate transport system substrate-binding protein
LIPMFRQVTDQMGRMINVPAVPKRIVSLVPSQTELLYDIGLVDEVVGQTLFCIHPGHMHRTKPRVGGTKNFSIQKIRDLQPDLIIGNKEENDKERIEALQAEFPVWMSDIQNLDDSLSMIVQIGELVGKKDEAAALYNTISQSFGALHTEATGTRVLYLIWRNPWMAAGHHTFIHDMLLRCGFSNVLVDTFARYPELSAEQIHQLNPQVILLSSEPYPFKQIHADELNALVPSAQILQVDGELFSWYGSRLMHSVRYFSDLLQHINR